MENFFANLLRHRLLICMVFLLVLIGGISAFRHLPIDAFPDLTNNQVQILSESPGMAPVEVEQLVTIPIESLMNGLPKVQEVRSISKFGLSVITVVFDDAVNTYFARQLVNERLQSARARLPGNINPELGPITTGMGEVYQYVVEGFGYTPTDLKTLHDWEIKYQLRSVPGVNEVNTWGGFTQEYQVIVSPNRLLQYGLTLPEVFEALQNNNDNFSGGIIEHSSEQYIVRGVGRLQKLSEIRNIVVKYQDDVPIYIGNIADVEYGHALRQGAVTKDGKGEVVTGIVMMLKGENSREVIERVKDKIGEIRKSLPEGVFIRPFYDQTRLVNQTLNTVETNLIEGGLLVVTVLLFMLGNLRAALIVALSIPLSLMFSFMGMKALGISANIMSLGAIDFGMIVDGSIVMVENTLRKLSHRENNQATFTIIQESVREMAKPILFGVLIITVVYLPILSLQGMEYRMFSPMVFTVCFALLGSLLIALTLVPVLCTFLLKLPAANTSPFLFREWMMKELMKIQAAYASRKRVTLGMALRVFSITVMALPALIFGKLLTSNIEEKENALIQKIKHPYLKLLINALNHRKTTVGLALLTFVVAIAMVPFLGTEFVPQLDEGDLIIEVRNLPSISLPEANQVSTRIEQAIVEFPEIKTVVSRTGRPDLATDPMGVYQTDMYVILNPQSHWRAGMTKDWLVEQLRQKLQNTIPGTNFSFTQPIAMRVNELVSGVRADIAIKLFGEDTNILAQKAAEIENVMQKVGGVADLQVEQLSGSGQLLITPDRSKMALYGVNITDIRNAIGTAIIGTAVSEVIEGRKRFDLRVKFPEGSSFEPEALENLLIETQNGTRVPLSQVALIRLGEGLEVVNREFGQRRIIIQSNVRGRDIGSFVQEGQRRISESVKLPPGYHIEWGGQFENQQRAMSKLMFVVPISIFIIFLLLMATFSSIRHSLLVMLNVPFALIGGVFALALRDMYLSVPASIGFIALFGVAILNGLVLITTINRLLQQGHSVEEAVLSGSETRLRPVLMTALVAFLGFLPMAMSQGAGAEVQKPLATVVMGGLVSSTLLTLIVLPVLYSWVESKRSVREVQ